MERSLKDGKFSKVLSSPIAQQVLGHDPIGNENIVTEDSTRHDWTGLLNERIDHILAGGNEIERERVRSGLVLVGIAALHAFLQSNVTGPPLEWSSANLILPSTVQGKPQEIQELRQQLVGSLTIDGEAAYQLTPNVELFCLARSILNHPLVGTDTEARWARLRVNFWHQRMLSENSASLQAKIYDDLDGVERDVLAPPSDYDSDARTRFLLERGAIHTFHGFDAKARTDLNKAARQRDFQYVLTGRLGKRTRYQEKELSQLVVLAKSADSQESTSSPSTNGHINDEQTRPKRESDISMPKPQNLDLNDDTLLESISFTNASPNEELHLEEELPSTLASLDPANQPMLNPLDSIILLSLASSITNTSPQHGLTREETLPYATRVLEGGSSNWQVYTQALLVRSRIEGYRSRTVERGVLQLQALVDQVIADTTPSQQPSKSADDPQAQQSTPSTFLPRPKTSESASVSERLEYIHQLASPTRWTLEAELAARWVSLGGLRTALEIYERLEMWAETALCWAAVEREDKAKRILRRQLYKRTPTSPTPDQAVQVEETAGIEPDEDAEEYHGEERSPLPADAPRLFCVLGDLHKSPTQYERAWAVSNNRYARAQRSLGKHYLAIKDFQKADEAYSKSLRINPQNQSTWFALGCVRLELRDWKGAVDAFGRTVQIEDTDAEAWSNLAAALLRLPPEESVTSPSAEEDAISLEKSKPDLQKHTREAFVAFKRAAALKRDSYRIWQNLLNVSATLSPPPYSDLIIAQQRLIELRGPTEGESCIDIEVMEGLLSHIIASSTLSTSTSSTEPHRSKHGLEHMFTTLIQTHVTPLITHSRRLWQLLARFSLHQNHPSSALDASEKAWRVTLNKPGWEDGSSAPVKGGEVAKDVWKEVVDATIELVDAYESLGERERTEGLGGGSGEVVCRQWRFKARSAIRGVLGRGRGRWEGSEGWVVLGERTEGLKG